VKWWQSLLWWGKAPPTTRYRAAKFAELRDPAANAAERDPSELAELRDPAADSFGDGNVLLKLADIMVGETVDYKVDFKGRAQVAAGATLTGGAAVESATNIAGDFGEGFTIGAPSITGTIITVRVSCNAVLLTTVFNLCVTLSTGERIGQRCSIRCADGTGA